MWIERKIPFEEFKDKQLNIPFIEELSSMLSVQPDLVEFVIHPHDDMVDVNIDWTTLYVITKRQYLLLMNKE